MPILSPWIIALMLSLFGSLAAANPPVVIEAKPVKPTPENTDPIVMKVPAMPEFKTDIPCYPTALVALKAKTLKAELLLSAMTLDGFPFVVYGYPDDSVAVMQASDKMGNMLCLLAVVEEPVFNQGLYLRWKSRLIAE